MNIIIFAAVDVPAGPASTARVRHLARLLVLAGNRVTIASLQPNARSPYPENTRTEGEFDGIGYIYLSGNLVRPSGLWNVCVDTLKGCFGAVTFLLRKRREKVADLILFYTPDFFVILPTLLCAKLCGIPVVLELCEINSSKEAESFRQRLRHLGTGLTDKILPKTCSGTIVISTKIKEWLLACGVVPQRIFHLPILVDWREFGEPSGAEIPLLSGKKYFLNSGALGEKDGCEFLLQAFATLGREHQDVYLVFTGEPAPHRKQYVEDLARELGIEQRILFTGFLSKSGLVWSYQHATGLLCCRNSSTFASYGSPNKLSEYLSTGKPVITNEMGDTGLYLVNNEHAFFARVADHESIAQQMHLVLTEPGLAAQIGREGQGVAKRYFHYENYVSSLDTFIRASSRMT